MLACQLTVNFSTGIRCIRVEPLYIIIMKRIALSLISYCVAILATVSCFFEWTQGFL